jgi:hypothetical protein
VIFKVLSVVTIKIRVLCDVTPCNLAHKLLNVSEEPAAARQGSRWRQQIAPKVSKYLPD